MGGWARLSPPSWAHVADPPRATFSPTHRCEQSPWAFYRPAHQVDGLLTCTFASGRASGHADRRVLPIVLPGSGPPGSGRTGGPAMQGHVARKRDRYYAVIYEGLDPVTGKERRTWHPAGTDRTEAERLVARLAAERDGRNDEVRSLTLGAYLTGHWLPAKRLELRASTHRSYVHKTQRHILPTLGRRRLRRLRPEDLEGLYDSMLHPTDGTRPLAPKTV